MLCRSRSFKDYALDAAKGMDAVRVDDDALVWIKRCLLENPANQPESISEFRLNNLLRDDDDPDNHCLPLLDSFTDQNDTSWEFTEHNHRYVCLVFPWALVVDRHAWHLAVEAIDFVRQLIEVCHRTAIFCLSTDIQTGSGVSSRAEYRSSVSDCALPCFHADQCRDIQPENITMSLHGIYDAGTSPLRNIMVLADMEDASPFADRIEVPASYYYIDLGLSTQFADDNHHVVWEAGSLKLPEVFGTTTPSERKLRDPPQVAYDAFAGDVWQLGTTFRRYFGNVRPQR